MNTIEKRASLTLVFLTWDLGTSTSVDMDIQTYVIALLCVLTFWWVCREEKSKNGKG